MIQPGFKIHESSRVWAWDASRWRSFPITRRTAKSVFIETSSGELRIDRLPLERWGRARSHGQTYYLSRRAPRVEETEDQAA